MTKRLAILLAVLLTATSMLLGLPWARWMMIAGTRTVFYQLTSDAQRLATQAADIRTQADVRDLQSTLQRYHEVYGTPAVLLDTQATVVVSSSPGYHLPASAARDVQTLVSGRLLQEPDSAWPWDTAPLIVGQPVVRGGDFIGVVVVIDRGGRHSASSTWTLGILLFLTLSVLMISVASARLLAGWVLRPVHELGKATARIHAGELGAQVIVGTGPPELRSFAAEFNRMSLRVQEVVEAQQNFVSDATHQLRNPLNALLLRLEALMPVGNEAEPAPEPAPGAAATAADPFEPANAALQAGRSLARTLDDMLAMASATDGEADASHVDVGKIVDDRLALWSVIAEQREVRIVRTGAASAVALHAVSCIEGAFDSIIDNALKFSGRLSTVSVDVSTEGSALVVAVRDEGPGLLESELPRVQDRFWRSRRHTNVPGSGLGVPIAARLVAQHGGSVHVANHESGGLEVRLVLPEPAT